MQVCEKRGVQIPSSLLCWEEKVKPRLNTSVIERVGPCNMGSSNISPTASLLVTEDMLYCPATNAEP